MKLRPFELALIIIFLVLIIASLFLLQTFRSSDRTDEVRIGAVEIWGTLPADGIEQILREKVQVSQDFKQVSYRYIPLDEFNSTFINALAEGRGPDVLLLSSEQLVEQRSKLRATSYESFSRRDIASTYVDGAQLFAMSDGLYALPLMLDPLVMYWNKDLLARENFLVPPATWEALVNDYVPALTESSADRSVQRSAVALGEYENIKQAHAIISMLFLQAGSYGVTQDGEGFYQIRLNESPDGTIAPLQVAMEFYTRFARPDNTLYSWNRSFSSDRDRFGSGDLALYFGLGSEARNLEQLNPNLNFDIAEVPQGAAATVKRTYGTHYGLALVRSSDNLRGASVLLQELGSSANAEALARAYDMVPAHRALVAQGSDDIYGRVTYKSAGIAYGWLQPSRQATDMIFRQAIREVVENRSNASNAVDDALQRLEVEYNR